MFQITRIPRAAKKSRQQRRREADNPLKLTGDVIHMEGSADRSESDIHDHIHRMTEKLGQLRDQEATAQAELALAIHEDKPTSKPTQRLQDIRAQIEVVQLTIQGLEQDAITAHERELWEAYQRQVNAEAQAARVELELWTALAQLTRQLDAQISARVQLANSRQGMEAQLQKPRYGTKKRDIVAVQTEAELLPLTMQLMDAERQFKSRNRTAAG